MTKKGASGPDEYKVSHELRRSSKHAVLTNRADGRLFAAARTRHCKSPRRVHCIMKRRQEGVGDCSETYGRLDSYSWNTSLKGIFVIQGESTDQYETDAEGRQRVRITGN